MRETSQDIVRLQRLLDESYEKAGEHLRSIITPERRGRARARTTGCDDHLELILDRCHA